MRSVVASSIVADAAPCASAIALYTTDARFAHSMASFGSALNLYTLATASNADASPWASPWSRKSSRASFAAIRASMSLFSGAAFRPSMSGSALRACSSRALATRSSCCASPWRSPFSRQAVVASFASFRTSLTSWFAKRMLAIDSMAADALGLSPMLVYRAWISSEACRASEKCPCARCTCTTVSSTAASPAPSFALRKRANAASAVDSATS
mmetsp:Transcript_98099/g.316349  ORF Transcript_98099/g.316349 Transcript_98099/m.316349 type:complete len:213 (-) Transcript_98099:836-1474(-)